jgi:hypothetical protein
MSGALPLLPLYAFMAWIGGALSFYNLFIGLDFRSGNVEQTYIYESRVARNHGVIPAVLLSRNVVLGLNIGRSKHLC